MARPTRRRLVVGVVLAAVASLATVAVVSPAGPAAAAPPPTSSFEKVRLDGGLSMGEPIELSVLTDGKVLYINRGTSSGGGQVRLYNPATGLTTVALTLQLDARFEDGLIGITLHPQFATNRWVFLFYSPAQATLVNRVSRFTFNPSTNVLDPASEDMIIEWPTERRLCCHSAGSMTWDSNNNLYFAVGDNTNSGGDSAGMAPIDERTARDAQYDAGRTSGNTNDLRGKINRIHPESNGTYTGSVYGFQGPNFAARDAALNPPGSWNTYEIGVHGQRVEIWLNGVKINDYTSTPPARARVRQPAGPRHPNSEGIWQLVYGSSGAAARSRSPASSAPSRSGPAWPGRSAV